ncbi:VOC family protein [Alcaligenaceae bacterium]|nr:VOC family protein [Alcaligenaceae bacterium]
MLKSLEGLDHIVILTQDLDLAAAQWLALGFTLSPRGTHSAHIGTGNYTIMLGNDYLELLGVLQATDLNTPSLAFLERRGSGIERAAFTTNNAAAGVAALRDLGLEIQDPVEFSRPVTMPDGKSSVAAFSVFHWPANQHPADLRIFACQHHTRDTVWLPHLQQHANMATGILRIEIIAPDPGATALQLAQLIDGQAQPGKDGMHVATAAGRGEFVFLTKAAFLARHPSVSHDTLPNEGAVALVLKTQDLNAAARAAGGNAVVTAGSVTVPAGHASGVILVFEQ